MGVLLIFDNHPDKMPIPNNGLFTLSENLKVRFTPQKRIQIYYRASSEIVHPEIYTLPASTIQLLILGDILSPETVILDKRSMLLYSLVYPETSEIEGLPSASVRLGDKHLLVSDTEENEQISQGEIIFTPEMWSELESWIEKFKVEIDDSHYEIYPGKWTELARTVE